MYGQHNYNAPELPFELLDLTVNSDTVRFALLLCYALYRISIDLLQKYRYQIKSLQYDDLEFCTKNINTICDMFKELTSIFVLSVSKNIKEGYHLPSSVVRFFWIDRIKMPLSDMLIGRNGLPKTSRYGKVTKYEFDITERHLLLKMWKHLSLLQYGDEHVMQTNQTFNELSGREPDTSDKQSWESEPHRKKRKLTKKQRQTRFDKHHSKTPKEHASSYNTLQHCHTGVPNTLRRQLKIKNSKTQRTHISTTTTEISLNLDDLHIFTNAHLGQRGNNDFTSEFNKHLLVYSRHSRITDISQPMTAFSAYRDPITTSSNDSNLLDVPERSATSDQDDDLF